MSFPDTPRPFDPRGGSGAFPPPVDPPQRHLRDGRPPEPPTPAAAEGLRTMLDQAEQHVELLRGTAAELKAVLPTRLEAAVSRALAGSEGAALARRVEDLTELSARTAETLRGVAADVLAERLGRAEDLELLVDLVSSGARATRADVARLEREVAVLSDTVARLTALVETVSPTLETISSKLDRPLSVTVEPRPPESRTADVVAPPPGGFVPPSGGDAY